MESEIEQLKNEIEQLKNENEQMKKKIDHLAYKNAYAKMNCIRDEDKSTFIVEINIVEDPDPIKLPIQMYVKSYCSDERFVKKENVEGKTYYIIYNDLPSAQVFAKYAWKRLCDFMCNRDAACFDDEETIFIPIWWTREISPELVNEDIPRMIEVYNEVLLEEKRKLGWCDCEDNISDNDFDCDYITDSEEYENSDEDDEDDDDDTTDNDGRDDEDILTGVDECDDECDDEECAPIDLTILNGPAC